MSFTGNPGTGKTTVALRMAEILHRLGYVRKGHLVSVTRDDLVGQYIGHTAPKTKEVLKRAMGGVLFIDEAYYLYRPENERDYGLEAIEILLQVMENQRDDLVVILAGYKDRMDTFFRSNPGLSSRIAHHIDFPDYDDAELAQIAQLMLAQQDYRLDDEALATFREYVALRRCQPHFANARSVRNALDRARLRQANRLFASGAIATREGCPRSRPPTSGRAACSTPPEGNRHAVPSLDPVQVHHRGAAQARLRRRAHRAGQRHPDRVQVHRRRRRQGRAQRRRAGRPTTSTSRARSRCRWTWSATTSC